MTAHLPQTLKVKLALVSMIPPPVGMWTISINSFFTFIHLSSNTLLSVFFLFFTVSVVILMVMVNIYYSIGDCGQLNLPLLLCLR